MIFAELLDRRGRVRERVRVAPLPFTLGRSYQNDWILDDPYVCPHHAHIEANGAGDMVLRDLSSENGVVALSPPRRVREIPIHPGTAVQLGRSTIRFRPADHRVPPALAVPTENGGIRHWLANHWSAALCGLLAVWVTAAIEAVRTVPDDIESFSVAVEILVSSVVLVLWAGLWALITRVLSPRSRFSGHLVLTCGAFVLTVGIERLVQYGLFLFGASGAVDGLRISLQWVLVFALVLGQMRLAGALRPLTRLAFATAFAVTFTFLVHYDEISPSYRGQLDALPYATALERIDPSWLPTASPDTFFAEARTLGPELDELAREIEAREAAR